MLLLYEARVFLHNIDDVAKKYSKSEKLLAA